MQIARVDEGAQVAFFPSDHFFGNEHAFISAIERAFDVAEKKRDSVILLGANAERPETEYGWIEPECGAEEGGGFGFSPVRRFWEKPALETAKELERQGCLWNTFVMIGSAGAFLEMIRHAAPVVFETFEAALASDAPGYDEHKMTVMYDGIGSSDFSREVLALSTERLLVTSCGEAGWSDLGEPRRFIAALTKSGDENPWAVKGVCDKCGLTRQQIVTLSGQERSLVTSR